VGNCNDLLIRPLSSDGQLRVLNERAIPEQRYGSAPNGVVCHSMTITFDANRVGPSPQKGWFSGAFRLAKVALIVIPSIRMTSRRAERVPDYLGSTSIETPGGVRLIRSIDRAESSVRRERQHDRLPTHPIRRLNSGAEASI
jgi:hypothetical protein